MAYTKAALALVALVGSAKGQSSFFDAPQPKWTATFRPMLDNNGMVWAPDDSLVYATSSDGVVAAFNPDDGIPFKEFQPSGDGTTPFFCTGEVDFNAAGDTLIYAVTAGDSCKVYALSHGSLEVVWESPELAGVCEGTPKYADDDAYVFVTHNAADGSAGRFSVLDTAAGATVLYNFEGTDGPFGPFGFYPSPFPGGNYGAGAGNSNDLAIWGLKPSPGAATGEMGAVYAFQMPPSTAIGGPAVTQIIATTGWRHTAPPLLASMGQWAYWLMSRSQIRAWYGSTFSIGSDGEYGFDRGVPTFKSAPYTGAVDNNDAPTIFCGGPANPEFACFTANAMNDMNGDTPLWTVPTGGTGVYGNPLMSTGGDRVYWTDDAGLVSAQSPATGMGGWTAPTGANLLANPTLSSDGARLFFADSSGTIVCWDVAEGTLGPAVPPSIVPTAPTAPTVAPPTTAETTPPSPAPSQAPSAEGETYAPSASPAPTESPVATPAPVDASPTTAGGAVDPPTAAPPTMAPDSGSSSLAVFSVIAASIVAALFF